MMIDQDVAAASASSVYRVLSDAGLLDRWNPKPSKKGTGFVQPVPHEHWHIDVAYLNLGGTFYYLCSVLDGASRAIVHWEIREAMTETDVECILLRAHELFPHERPRIISNNGPQVIAKDFKEFIRLTGMTHVRTSPYYPQSNGKIERWHKTLKEDSIRPASPPPSTRPALSSLAGLRTTTPSACTARSATSRRPTSSLAARPRSGPPVSASSRPPAKLAAFAAPPPTKRRHDRLPFIVHVAYRSTCPVPFTPNQYTASRSAQETVIRPDSSAFNQKRQAPISPNGGLLDSRFVATTC
jgi:Integrase core domain